MNRFFRTAYSATLAFYILTLVTVTLMGAMMPFPAFSCLYFGLLVFLMPGFIHSLAGKERLFNILGAALAFCGFFFIWLYKCPAAYHAVYAASLVSAALFTVLLRENTSYNDFEAKFRFTLVVAAVITAFLVVAGISDSGIFDLHPEYVVSALNCLVPIAIVLLATGILLLRGLRAQQGVVDDRAFNRRQLRDTLIFASVVTVVFIFDPVKYIKLAFDWLVHTVLRRLYYWLYDLIGKFFALITVPHKVVPSVTALPTASSEVIDITPPPELVTAEPDVAPQSERFFNTLTVLFMIIVGLILLYILVKEFVKLLKKLRNAGKGKGSGYPNEIREELPPEDDEPKEDKPSKRSSDPRERMRWMYAEFMRRLRRGSVPIKMTDTCSEIGVHAKTATPSEADNIDEFTGLYEKARYNLNEQPEESDALRMKALLGEMKDK